MPHFHEHLNILVMPTNACNMNCVYCFHQPYQVDSQRMDMETVKRIFDITAPYYKKINIIWHGGEPLLMGKKFYEQVVRQQKNYDCEFRNSIQTNLILMNFELAQFFAENDFSVSSSFDGVCNEDLRGNSKEIILGRNMVTKTGKRCGLIMVVSKKNIDTLIESYKFFKGLDVNYSLNLYLDQKDNANTSLRLDRDNAIIRLNELFDYWANDTEGNIHISYFRNILEYILLKKKTVCVYTSCMGRWIGISHDGEIVPCNRYFPKEYSYGNVFDYEDIGEAFESEGFKKLIQKAISRREKCKSCDIYNFCNGGCNNTAMNENGIENNSGLSCYILKGVYEHIDRFICNIKTSSNNRGLLNPKLLEILDKNKKLKGIEI